MLLLRSRKEIRLGWMRWRKSGSGSHNLYLVVIVQNCLGILVEPQLVVGTETSRKGEGGGEGERYPEY